MTKAVRRTRHQMNLHIDSGYYGFRDEEDGVLLKDEAEAEQRLQAAAIEQYETEQKLRELEGGTRKKASTTADAGGQFVAHVPLVDEADIEREVLSRKKQELLAKYVSEDLQRRRRARRRCAISG